MLIFPNLPNDGIAPTMGFGGGGVCVAGAGVGAVEGVVTGGLATGFGCGVATGCGADT